MDGKHTPGPWTVLHGQKWPFGIFIEPEVAQLERIAYSSSQHCLDDVRAAVGFPQKHKPGITALVQEQEANANLIAQSPSMYDALHQWRAAERTNDAQELENARGERDRILDLLEGGAA